MYGLRLGNSSYTLTDFETGMVISFKTEKEAQENADKMNDKLKRSCNGANFWKVIEI